METVAGVLLEERQELEAVHPGHDGVDDEQVGPAALSPGQAVAPVVGLLDDELLLAQEMGDQVPGRRVVVDEEHFGRGALRDARRRRDEPPKKRGPMDLRVNVEERRSRGEHSAGSGDEVFEVKKGLELDGDELDEHRPMPLDPADGILDVPQERRFFDAAVHGVPSLGPARRLPEEYRSSQDGGPVFMRLPHPTGEGRARPSLVVRIRWVIFGAGEPSPAAGRPHRERGESPGSRRRRPAGGTLVGPAVLRHMDGIVRFR